MEPIKFKEANVLLKPPANMPEEECTDLPVFHDGMQFISKWKLDESEKAHVAEHGYIYIVVLSQKHPPIMGCATDQMFTEAKPDIQIIDDIGEAKLLKDIIDKAKGYDG